MSAWPHPDRFACKLYLVFLFPCILSLDSALLEADRSPYVLLCVCIVPSTEWDPVLIGTYRHYCNVNNASSHGRKESRHNGLDALYGDTVQTCLSSKRSEPQRVLMSWITRGKGCYSKLLPRRTGKQRGRYVMDPVTVISWWVLDSIRLPEI